MRSRSENMLRGIEYMNWYQVIRPIGYTVNEKSRVEILKVADDSDLRLRDNVPWGLKERAQDSMLQDPGLLKLASIRSNPNEPDIPTTLNFMKRHETETYLSPKLKDFQDQEREIEEIFWELLKSVHPICPDDIDLQAIREALAERQAKLGRDKKEEEPSEGDLFDKYGLGLNARKTPEDGLDTTEVFKPPKNELFDMIDRMAAERMKPEPQQNDMYDKNYPIRGKVGFRRDENGQGPRSYTDLDEILSFGDLDKDVNFQKYLVQQKRGRFDSDGNFISGMFDSKGNFIPGRRDSKGNFIPGIYDDKGHFIPGKYDSKGRFIPGKVDSEGNFIPGRFKDGDHTDDDIIGDSKRKSRKKGKKGKKGDTDSESLPTSSKSRRGKSLADMTEADRQKYLEDLRKSKRHPDIDFPMCNYPKWVHRMYRMDQVKIGQLIKQGMDVPQYTPTWMLDTLDRVWGNKDPKSRGTKPSNDPKQGKSRFGGFDHSKAKGAKGKTSGAVADSEFGKKLSKKGAKVEDEHQERRGSDRGKGGLGGQAVEEGIKGEGYGKDKGLIDGLGGLADFLQGYEKEMVDLARLEAGTDKENKKKKGETSFDMDDLIDQYHNELLREENIYKQDREKFHMKEKMEEKARKIKERQEAALKRIREKEKKLKQQEEIKEREKAEKELKQKELREKLQKMRAQNRGSSDKLYSGIKGQGKGRKGKGKGRDLTDRKTAIAETEPCAEFKASNMAKVRDDECMKRFQFLLSRKKSRYFGGTDFLELAKQISLFKYSPTPPKKTPCERVEMPIC